MPTLPKKHPPPTQPPSKTEKKKPKTNLFGTKMSSSNKSWNKMREIESRDREDSNITPQSIPYWKILSVFCNGIAYSCPKPSVFLSKGNNFLMCLRSWISMWKHNFQVFFVRKMEFYVDFFFQKWLLKKNTSIFWKAVNWVKLMRFSFFRSFQAMNTLVL